MDHPVRVYREETNRRRAFSAALRTYFDAGTINAAMAAVDARSQKIAQDLSSSVLPLFVDGDRRPVRNGSCVLLRVGDLHALATAAHVVRQGAPRGFFTACGGRMLRIPSTTAVVSTEVDAAVIPLPSAVRKVAEWTFVPAAYARMDSTSERYVVTGYPESTRQTRFDSLTKHFDTRLFHSGSNPMPESIYQFENVHMVDHLLLDADIARGKNAPDPAGISGGGMFWFQNRGEQGTLVAINTEYRKASKTFVGVRLFHHVKMILDHGRTHPEDFE